MAQLVFPFKVANNNQKPTNNKLLTQPTNLQLLTKIQTESNKLQTKLNQLQSTDTTMLSKFNQIQARDTTMLTKLNQIQARDTTMLSKLNQIQTSINTPQLSAVIVPAIQEDEITNGTQYFKLLFSPELYNIILQKKINNVRLVSQPDGINMVALNYFGNPNHTDGYVDATNYISLTYETLFWEDTHGQYYNHTSQTTLSFQFRRAPDSGVVEYTLPGIYTVTYIPYVQEI